MTNPERSVEECTQEIISQMTGDDLSKDRMSWLIKTALQAERKRCEEVVEAEREFWKQIVANQKVEIEMLRAKPDKQIFITQPNNPTSENN